jgi:hypothetical protein
MYIRPPPIAAAAADATRRFAFIARIATLLGMLGLPRRLRVRRPPIAAAMLLFADFALAIIFAIALFSLASPPLHERFILRRVRAIYIFTPQKYLQNIS